jgi:hypothetical protein
MLKVYEQAVTDFDDNNLLSASSSECHADGKSPSN